MCCILNFATKTGSHHQNPTARSKSYWALGAQVPPQFPRLMTTRLSSWEEDKMTTTLDRESRIQEMTI